MAFKPFDPGSAIHNSQQNLPHWRQAGTTYFVTTRLADSVPATIAAKWQAKRDAWLRDHGAESAEDLADEFRLDYQRQFTDAFHDLIDAGYGECLLARQECANVVIGKMIEGHGTCFQLGAWAIMPNHVHAVVEPARGSSLGEIVKHWKGGSAFLINRLLGRSGTLWMPEPFDHIIRSLKQWRRHSLYVADNPMKAGLAVSYVLGDGAEIGLTREAMHERIERCVPGL